MKNWKSITAGVSCLSMLLTAGMSTTSAAEITEIPEQSIVYWSMWEENEPQADVIKEAAEDYEAATGISVEIEWKGREIQSLIEPALDAGEQIDLFDDDYQRMVQEHKEYLAETEEDGGHCRLREPHYAGTVGTGEELGKRRTACYALPALYHRSLV